jgi:hypothetical protein
MNRPEGRLLKLTAVLLLLLYLPSERMAAATAGFQPAVNYSTGAVPKGVAIGDFNGDGKPDLAVANNGDANAGDDGNVSILFGNGDGTFQSANNVPGGKNPFTIATADFNRDSKADLVLIDSSGVGVLLGNGDGTFRPVTYLATASGPLSLAVADFDGNSALDFVVVTQTSLSVLLGNGDGTFQAHVDYPAGGLNIAVADINSDGRLDLTTERPQSGGAVLTTVLLGNGDGTFQNGIGTAGLQFGRQLVVSDFNVDGKADVALGFLFFPAKGTFIMAGNGDGTFQQSSATLPLFGATSAADFNGDGKPDLVIIDITSGGVASLFLGNGDGTFQSPLSFAVGGGPQTSSTPLWAAAAADFNQDNAPDLVVTNSPDNNISVLLNTTGADFTISASAATPATVSRGQSSTSTVTLSHQNTFDNPVALTCSVQPTQSAPTCSIDPNSVTFDANGNATATLTMSTGAATASLAPSSLRDDAHPLQFLWLPMAGLALIGTSLDRRRSNAKKVAGVVLGALLLGGLIFQAACGGESGPRSQTYTVTITGTSQSTQHSTTLKLVVQ